MSDSEVSCDDPFSGTQTDSDEDYIPENARNRRPNLKMDLSQSSSDNDTSQENENDEEQPGPSRAIPQVGKKRLQRKSLWNRNIRKAKRNQGKFYTNSVGLLVSEKKIGENCNCKHKCFDKIGEEGCNEIFAKFYSISSKDLQDAYLYGLIKRRSVGRKRPRSGDGNGKMSSFSYVVRHTGEEKTTCKKAFFSLHGITKSRLERLQKHLSDQNVTAPIDRRGKHQNRVNKLPTNTSDKIRDHILSFPRYKSHYSRKNNLYRYYLSPLLSISKLHQLYLEKHEPEQHALMLQNLRNNPVVKYEYFRKFFNENFKIQFGKPKSDTCAKCDKLTNKINAADPEAEKSALETEKSLHIRKAEHFYTDLKAKTNLLQNHPEMEVITFDYQQNLPLPVSSSGEVFYKIQLWLYNFCIHVGSSKKSYFYVYDETLGSKGQNEIASLIFHFLNNHLRPEVTEIHIFSDNCASQNKNYTLVQFFFSLIQTNKYTVICHRYPEPGHSFLPCDRSFGLIEVEKRKHDKIFLPRDYISIIRGSSKKFEVIPVTQDFFLNFKDHLQQFFLKNPSKKNNKFTISKYRILRYEKTDSGTLVKCSESVGIPLFVEFDIRNNKILEPISLPNNTQKLFSGRRLLKKNKFEHVISLAKNYVPLCDQWFYNEIVNYHQAYAAPDNDTSISEYSSDE